MAGDGGLISAAADGSSILPFATQQAIGNRLPFFIELIDGGLISAAADGSSILPFATQQAINNRLPFFY
jgi:hypothetical protein